MKNVRTYAELAETLTKRATAIKNGSQQKRAGEESGQTPPVPERDPRAEGTVAIPKDPDGAPGKAVGLERPTNAEVTSSFTVPPDRTVTGEEKPAKELSKKAQQIAAGIRNLSASLSKKADGTVGSDGKSVTPNMPPNTQVNEGTTQGGKNQPPSGGAGDKNNPDPNAKTSGVKAAGPSMNAEGTDKEKKVSLPAGDSKGNIPDSKTNTDASKGQGQAAVQSKSAAEAEEEKCKGCGMVKSACICKKGEGDKMAAADDFPIDASYHLKLASLLIATEEGREYAQRLVEKAHGAEAAADIVKAAAIMEERAIEMAQLENEGAIQAEEMWKSASEEDRNKIVKLARVHTQAREQYKTDLEKLAYDAGAMTAAQMGDAGMLGGAPAGVGPEAGAEGAPAGLPPGAGMPPGMEGGAGGGAGGEGGAGGGEELSPEAVVAALDQMVSSGELTPELAAEILQAIVGGGGEGGEAGGGAPPGAGAGEGGGGEKEEGGGKEEKESRFKSAQAITTATLAQMVASKQLDEKVAASILQAMALTPEPATAAKAAAAPPANETPADKEARLMKQAHALAQSFITK